MHDDISRHAQVPHSFVPASRGAYTGCASSGAQNARSDAMRGGVAFERQRTLGIACAGQLRREGLGT